MVSRRQDDLKSLSGMVESRDWVHDDVTHKHQNLPGVYGETVQLVRDVLVEAHQLAAKKSAVWDPFLNQLVRCCSSVAANIAEGWGRAGYRQYWQFLRIARGSMFETLMFLRVMPSPFCTQLVDRAEPIAERLDAEVLRALNAAIDSLVEQPGRKRARVATAIVNRDDE